MARKIVFENDRCICYMAFSNSDYEEFDNVHGLINETGEIFITAFVYSKYYNCTEPYDGVSVKSPDAYRRMKHLAVVYCM